MYSFLSPFIALICNKSLVTGCFPRKYRHAVVFPLLKKHNLDASQPKNFRPVSNLPYLSKILEKVVQSQLQKFLDEHNMMPHISLPAGISIAPRQHCCGSTVTVATDQRAKDLD